MRLKCHSRIKDGKEHRYWSIVESVRCSRDRVVQRHVLYLGELNDSQREGWTRCLDAVDEKGRGQQLALFPADRQVPDHALGYGVQVRLDAMRLERPRQWGACWLFTELWSQLRLDAFWQARLPDSREGTSWYHTLVTLVRLSADRSGQRVAAAPAVVRSHARWRDLLEEDFSLAAKDNLYRVLDKLLAHKRALFSHLQERWKDLFGASFDVLLYDLTSTYFESDPPEQPNGPAPLRLQPRQAQRLRAGRHRPDRHARGLPAGLRGAAGQHGRQDHAAQLPGENRSAVWQGTTASGSWTAASRPKKCLAADARADEPPVQYLVGTPKGRLSKIESELLKRPWQQAREGVRVKLLPQDEELYVCAESQDRVGKERAMRRRRLGGLIAPAQRTASANAQAARPAAQTRSRQEVRPDATGRCVDIDMPERPTRQSATARAHRLHLQARRKSLRIARRREGRYLLRSNLTDTDPEKLWTCTSNSPKSSKPSKTSKAISACGRSITRTRAASRRTSWSASWLTAST